MANPVAWGIRRAGSAGGAARPCATRALRRPRTAGILMAGLGLILAASSIAWIVIIRSLIAWALSSAGRRPSMSPSASPSSCSSSFTRSSPARLARCDVPLIALWGFSSALDRGLGWHRGPRYRCRPRPVRLSPPARAARLRRSSWPDLASGDRKRLAESIDAPSEQ